MPIPNRPTPEGTALGRQMARLCDAEISKLGRDDRCPTCAFRSGDHIANNSAETLMDALKCALEREPFWCHEHGRPCAGWLAMLAPADQRLHAPWDFVGGSDELPDVICLPDARAAA